MATKIFGITVKSTDRINDQLVSNIRKINTHEMASNRFDFTTTGTNPVLELILTDSPTVTWYWGDGTTSSGAAPSKTFVNTDRRDNYVTIEPASALTRINRNGRELRTVDNLGNFPNLNYLYFYSWTTGEHLDLVGCTAMREWHLLGAIASTTEVDQWIIDQAAAFSEIADSSISGNFYCPSRTSASDSARSIIIAKGITWH